MSRRASLKKRQRKEYTGSAESVAGVPTAAPGQQAEILSLQRSAGNRAVEQLLQPNADGKPHGVEKVPPGVESALNGSSGQPLDAATRDAMESILGQDLANVRVHTDAQAAESAEAVNALAYTAGQDIVFGSGRYAPETSEGRELLQHELAHTVQQKDANASGETTRILRAPNPAKSDPPSLFASTIPAPTVMRVGSSILATVYFGQNNFLMDSANLAAVDKLADELRFLVNPSVMVDGYTSSEGTAEYNQKLSELRRQTVIALLSAKSIGTAIMSGAAHGEADAATTETATDAKELESQRALNRRVTIFIMSSAASAPPAPEKSPLKLFEPPPLSGLKPETDQERFDRTMKELDKLGPVTRPKTSFSDEFWKGVDKVVDDLTRKAGVPEKYRGLIKDGAHSLIEKGAEKALDQALDQTNMSQNEKDAIKSAIKAAAQQKY